MLKGRRGACMSLLLLSVLVTLPHCGVFGTTSASTSVILIKGGTVVNHDQQFEADVLIEGDRIVDVSSGIQAPAGARVLDASGQYVMPGGIDPHTHLDMPFMGQVAADDFFSGHAAALAGGTTMHIDFALPVAHDLMAGYQAWKDKASRAVMDYGFHMAITKWDEQVSRDMGTLVAEGINSFKFFMAYKGALQVSDDELVRGFQRCRDLGALPMVHAENGDMVAWLQERLVASGVTGPEGHALSRPAVLEGEATGRAIRLARVVGVPLYVVHVMSIDAMEEVARARQAGQRVIGEPVASGLSVDESALWSANFTHAAAFVMSPPIRSSEHAPALRKALASGVLQLVATDHAVFNSSQKAVGRNDFRKIPNGVNGIEERMHVVWQEMVASGLSTPSDFVRMTSTAAAQIFNLYPRKGRLAAGSDADVVLLDPRVGHTLGVGSHHSRMDTNIYEGKAVQGKVTTTISRGRVMFEDGHLTDEVRPGAGRYVPMPPHGPLFHGLEQQQRRSLVFPYGPTPVLRSTTQAPTHTDEL